MKGCWYAKNNDDHNMIIGELQCMIDLLMSGVAIRLAAVGVSTPKAPPH